MTTIGEAAAKAGFPSDHVDYVCPGNHEDGGWTCQFCGGGLWGCSLCGGFEGAMPTQCPREKMTGDQADSVYRGETDYRHGKWVGEYSYYAPGGYKQALEEK